MRERQPMELLRRPAILMKGHNKFLAPFTHFYATAALHILLALQKAQALLIDYVISTCSKHRIRISLIIVLPIKFIEKTMIQ